MNRSIVQHGEDPFRLGWAYGHTYKTTWSSREANEKIAFATLQQEELFLNGMKDGQQNDTFRLDRRPLACANSHSATASCQFCGGWK